MVSRWVGRGYHTIPRKKLAEPCLGWSARKNFLLRPHINAQPRNSHGTPLAIPARPPQRAAIIESHLCETVDPIPLCTTTQSIRHQIYVSGSCGGRQSS